MADVQGIMQAEFMDGQPAIKKFLIERPAETAPVGWAKHEKEEDQKNEYKQKQEQE